MSEPNNREDLQQTAVMLEQILEVMPDDLFTLRALYDTQLKLEKPERALDCLKRLDDGARAAQNSGMIAFVIEQYESIVEHLPELRNRIDRLHEAQLVSNLMDAEPVGDKATDGRNGGIESEMALAWDLFQDEQLTQEEYSSVLHDLTEMSAREVSVPVTVLHILHDRNFSRFERLMTHLCQKSGVPIICLAHFEEQESLRDALPLDFISRFGALPFSQVGGELLLAVLNPMDRALVKQAETLSGRRCHIYLVAPQEYDQRLLQIKNARAA
jgi:hypothetical protein